MSEEQIIALLTEIRDLQKRNTENYERAIAKQQEAIDLQKQNVSEFRDKYLARQKTAIFVMVGMLIIAFIIVAYMPNLLTPHH
jgi:uncharacterized protein (UPF0305 family)